MLNPLDGLLAFILQSDPKVELDHTRAFDGCAVGLYAKSLDRTADWRKMIVLWRDARTEATNRATASAGTSAYRLNKGTERFIKELDNGASTYNTMGALQERYRELTS